MMQRQTGTGRAQGTRQMSGREVWRAVPARGKKRRSRLAVPVVLLFCFCMLAGLAYWFFGIFLSPEAVVAAGTAGEAGTVAVPTPSKDGRFVVVLDPGHGGTDTGTATLDGSQTEVGVVLEMAQRVAAYLALHEDEIEVVLTRQDNETYLSPKQRGEMTATVGADLLLSLHLNAEEYSPASVRGFQVFAQPPNHTLNMGSMQVARLLMNNVASVGLPILGDTGIYYMFYRDANDKEPYDSSWPIPEKELENVTYGVLQHASCPALLVEQWYLTNAADMALMDNESGKDAMARCLYQTVCDYFGVEART